MTLDDRLLRFERDLSSCISPEDKIEHAMAQLAFSLGALTALKGRKRAAEIAYRHADALATMGGE